MNAINELSPNPEITRFKGLGEISPDEFKHFIGKDMRLEQVTLRKPVKGRLIGPDSIIVPGTVYLVGAHIHGRGPGGELPRSEIGAVNCCP